MRDERTPKGDCEEATTPKESRHITCILEGKLSKCEVDVSPRKCSPLCLFFQLVLLLFPCLLYCISVFIVLYCIVYRKLITWSTHAGPQLKGPIVWHTKYQQILNTANKLEQIVREIGKGRWIKASKVYAHLKRSSHSQSARRQLPYTQDKNVTVEKDPVGLYARPPTTELVERGNCG